MKYIDLDRNVFIHPITGNKHRCCISRTVAIENGHYLYINPSSNIPFKLLGMNDACDIRKFCNKHGLATFGNYIEFPYLNHQAPVYRLADILNEALTEKYCLEENNNIKLYFD